MSRGPSPAYPEIVTPEAVVLDVERAGVASRALALAIDFLALAAIWTVLLLIAVAVFGGAGSVILAILYILFSLALYFVWFTLFETKWQRTPGKAALGLRVVSTDATPIRFTQAFLRAVLGIVDFFVLPIGCLAVVFVLLSSRDQRLGDMVAGTLVVRERAAAGFASSARFLAPPGYEAYATSLDVAAMKEEHYGLIRTFLLRAHQLNGAARVQLAVRLANPISRIIRHTPPAYLHPEAFLACVAAAWQHAHGAPISATPAPWMGRARYAPPGPAYPAALRPPPPPAPMPPPPPPPPYPSGRW
ncbi:MAG TPA: RDD family protein [Acidimicrobiales bacterium]|jgi:uncharacterized RDD family membrane protein YckC